MNDGKICISVAAETVDEMIRKIKLAERMGDMLEVRFDSLQRGELEALHTRTADRCGPSNKIIESTVAPIISTLRPKDQGGYRELSWEEREDFWNGGFETEYCDLEEEFVDDSWSRPWRSRICSYHDLSGVPADIDAIFWRLVKTKAENIKIAVYAADATDSISVWKLLDHLRPDGKLSARRVIPIAMGEAGKWTRILGLAHGAFLTYASLDEGEETADGQITAGDLADVYRVKELNRETKVYGVIGDPVSGSLSPHMHNAAFTAAGLNAVFLPLLVKDLDSFFKRMVLPKTREVELNFAGFAVTMPHKHAALQYLDDIDSIAAAIGAVNTVTVDGGKLYGTNTDADGFIKPLKARFGDLRSARVAVLGAGGAARACVYALSQEGADVSVFARDPQNATGFASKFGAAAKSFSDLSPGVSNADIVVNATPLGMKGPLEHSSPLTAESMKGVKLVFDLVTNPNGTELTRQAELVNIPTLTGLEMLIEQGAKQFEIWTGCEAPLDVMRSAAKDRMEAIT